MGCFSITATKGILLSLTICSALTFFIFLFISQQAHLGTRNFSSFEPQSSIPIETQLEEPQNQARFENNSSLEGFLRNNSFNELNSIPEETHLRKPGDVSGFPWNNSSNESSEVNSIPEGTHLRKPGNVSGSARNLVFEKLHANEATSLVDKEKVLNVGSSGICDITKGKWVYEDKFLPLYTNASCPFIDEGFDCEGNGRLDKDYMKWRWQPQDCEIPRFNATKMLEIIRGKRLVFVGDSINRNQWESMLCLLTRAIKNPKSVYEVHGRRITKEKGDYSFKFVGFGAFSLKICFFK